MTSVNDTAEITVKLNTDQAKRDLDKLLQNTKGNTSGGSSGGSGGGGGKGPSQGGGGGGGGMGGGANAILGNVIKSAPQVAMAALAFERAAKLFERTVKDARDATDPGIKAAGLLLAQQNPIGYAAGHEGRAQTEAMNATGSIIRGGMGMLDDETIDAVHEQNKMIAGMNKDAAMQEDRFVIRHAPQNTYDSVSAGVSGANEFFNSILGAVMGSVMR